MLQPTWAWHAPLPEAAIRDLWYACLKPQVKLHRKLVLVARGVIRKMRGQPMRFLPCSVVMNFIYNQSHHPAMTYTYCSFVVYISAYHYLFFFFFVFSSKLAHLSTFALIISSCNRLINKYVCVDWLMNWGIEMGRPPCCDKSTVKRDLWTAEEDAKLLAYTTTHGTGNWTSVPRKAGPFICLSLCIFRYI